ncbi:MAG: magnesium/cobalt transporter CorA [Prolixibacteraceae bacterium]|nr:magnesium/cobalt transporter CorA [Prolixibacteraceae bacterium]MBN2774163.1 magnesium/cobalt transporter CorA [Prolixibacteraceae bacterium]
MKIHLQDQIKSRIPRFISKKKEEIGLPPGALHFRGVKRMEKSLIRAIDYSTDTLQEYQFETVDELIKFRDTPTTTWINIDGVHDNELMQKLADCFKIDPVILDDVMNTGIRPKIVEQDDFIFISVKMLVMDETGEKVNYEQLSLIITPSVLLTFQERKGDFFEPVRNRLRQMRKRIVDSGPDYLAFALLDIVIDNYIFILSAFGDKIEILEEKGLLEKSDSEVLDIIFRYKKELSYLVKNIKPVRELILAFSKSDSDLISEKTFFHITELRNNIHHATELLDNYREILSDQLNIYHTTASSKLNDKMKFLTIFSVIFIPLTFIAGVYGTNFDNLPELHFKYSYFIMWGIMVLLAVTMMIFFKRKKWF